MNFGQEDLKRPGLQRAHGGAFSCPHENSGRPAALDPSSGDALQALIWSTTCLPFNLPRVMEAIMAESPGMSIPHATRSVSSCH